MKKKLLIGCFLLMTMFPAELISQEKTYLEQGKLKLFYGESQESIVLFEKALKQYRAEKNETKIIESCNQLSKAYRSIFQLEKALDYANKALVLSRVKNSLNRREEANALDNIALVYSIMRRIDESLNHHNGALEIRTKFLPKDSLAQAVSFYNIGDRLQQKTKYKDAFDFLDKALKIDLEKTPETTILKANINESIGYIFYDQGKHTKALNHFEKSLSLTQEVFDENHIYFSKIYNQLGLVYSFREQLNESLMYYQKSLSISINKYGVDKHPSQIKVHFNIGTIYQKQGLTEKALYHTKKTLDLGIKMLGANHENLYFPYSQMGQIYGDERGIPYLEKALSIYDGKVEENAIRVSYLHDYLGKIHSKMNDSLKALKQYETSLNIRLKAFGKNSIHSIRSYNYVAKTFLKLEDFENAQAYSQKGIELNELQNIDEDLLLESVYTKADIYFKSYKKFNNKEHLKISADLYKRAVFLINSARIRKRNYDDKIKFSETVKSIYEKNIKTTLLLHQFDDEKSLETAFYYSEKSKANVLRELMKNPEAKEVSSIPKEVIEIESLIDTKIARLNSEILKAITDKKQDSQNIYSLEGKLLDETRRKDSLENKIEINFPAYHKLKYDSNNILISEIQEKLNEETTLIEFFKSNKLLYAFVISKNSFDVKELEIEDLDQKIQDFNESIVNKNELAFSTKSFELYQLLFKPIEEYLAGDNLIIIPDESLWHLQYELLLTEEKKIDKQKAPYLLYQYAISYGNSASLFFGDTKKNDKSDVNNECIAFSYSNDKSGSNSNTVSFKTLRNSQVDLPGTRKEILEISKIFEGKYFYGNNANETNFKDQVNQYKLVHLALHGEIDHVNPKNSKIYFTDDEEGKKEDNTLFGHELYALNIPAELVVLSACNTGAGHINTGEGILSLGNAFQYAGAKSLLLSRWEISDKTTPEVIKNFYKNLAEGMTKSKALQKAKIQFLESSDVFQSAPFYWGSFYLLGNIDPISIEPTTNYLLIFSFILAGIVFLFLVRKYVI